MQVKTIRKTHQHHSKMYIFLEKCTTTSFNQQKNQGDDILVLSEFSWICSKKETTSQYSKKGWPVAFSKSHFWFYSCPPFEDDDNDSVQHNHKVESKKDTHLKNLQTFEFGAANKT